MSYKKLSKNKLIEEYEVLLEKYNNLLQEYEILFNNNLNFENKYYELKDKKIDEFIKNDNNDKLDIINYLKKRINETNGDIKQRYISCLNKYLNL